MELKKQNKEKETRKIKRHVSVKFSDDCKFVGEQDQLWLNSRASNTQALNSIKQFPIDSKFHEIFSQTVSLRNSIHKKPNSKLKTRTQRIPFNPMKKKDAEIRQALQDIQSRGATFFKIGFTSEDKKNKEKKLFSDFYNIPLSDLKGTINYGELWTNKDRANFLKENKIRINKVKLIEKMMTLKKQNMNYQKILKRNSDTKYLFPSYKSFETLGFSSGKTIKSSQQIGSRNELEKNFSKLRKNIIDFKKQADNEHLEKILKKMETQNQNMKKVEQKYFQRLIQM